MNYASFEVEKLDPDTLEVLGVWPSMKDAARKTKTDYTGIAKSVRGDQLTAGGYLWRIRNIKNIDLVCFGGGVKIKVFNFRNGEVTNCNSIIAAAKLTGVSAQSIGQKTKKGAYEYKLFKFERVEGI